MEPTTAPVLPAFYGKPIDTPNGHKWAGYTEPTMAETAEDLDGTVFVVEGEYYDVWWEGEEQQCDELSVCFRDATMLLVNGKGDRKRMCVEHLLAYERAS